MWPVCTNSTWTERWRSRVESLKCQGNKSTVLSVDPAIGSWKSPQAGECESLAKMNPSKSGQRAESQGSLDAIGNTPSPSRSPLRNRLRQASTSDQVAMYGRGQFAPTRHPSRAQIDCSNRCSVSGESMWPRGRQTSKSRLPHNTISARRKDGCASLPVRCTGARATPWSSK